MASDMTVILITGANTGLGFQTVRALCGSKDRAYEILLGGRSLDKARKAAQDVVAEFASSRSRVSPMQIDIEDDASINAAFKDIDLRFGRLDVLLNNAGGQFDQQLTAGKMTMRDMWNKSWAVNVTSTQVITNAFVPLLLKSGDPRLLFIASGTSTLTWSEDRSLPMNKILSAGWPKTGVPSLLSLPAYRSSKTGMNMMMREWHRILKDDGVKVWCISPGWLATGLGGSQAANLAAGAGDPAPAGEFIKDVVEGERDGDVGKVVMKGKIQPW